MGMYTEIYVNVDLKEETPDAIIDTLQNICEGRTPEGFPSRTCCLFSNCSYYTPSTSVGHLTRDKISKQWSLLGKGDLKNYENEIDYFFTWLMPWIEGEPGDFIGYHRYEEEQAPTLVFFPTTPGEPGDFINYHRQEEEQAITLVFFPTTPEAQP